MHPNARSNRGAVRLLRGEIKTDARGPGTRTAVAGADESEAIALESGHVVKLPRQRARDSRSRVGSSYGRCGGRTRVCIEMVVKVVRGQHS